PDWRPAPLVLLAPVLQEVDPMLADAFDEAAVGAELQGWLRAMDGEGAISAAPWASPEATLARVQARCARRARAFPWCPAGPRAGDLREPTRHPGAGVADRGVGAARPAGRRHGRRGRRGPPRQRRSLRDPPPPP